MVPDDPGGGEEVPSPANREGDINVIDLETIKARAEAATPGPWKHEVQTGMIAGWPDEIIVLDRRLDVNLYEGEARIRGGHSASRRNAEFIAHARQDVPALVTEVEALRAAARIALEALNGAVAFATNPGDREKRRGKLSHAVVALANVLAYSGQTPTPEEMAALDTKMGNAPALGGELA